MWSWYTKLIALCFWLAQDYKKISLINICSAKGKMKGNFKKNWTWLIFFLYCGWLILDFILDFPWLIFLVGVSFANYWYLLHSFFKKSQNCNDNNFCIISNLFHHKHINNNFSMKNKEQVSLRNQFPWKTSFSARQVSLRN